MALAWPRAVVRTFDRSVRGESLFLPRGGGGGLRAHAAAAISRQERVPRGADGGWWGRSSIGVVTGVPDAAAVASAPYGATR